MEASTPRCGPAPSSVLSHKTNCLRLAAKRRPCQAEIADLEIAVGVEEEVGGLEVAMEDAADVYVERCGRQKARHEKVETRRQQWSEHGRLTVERDSRSRMQRL